MQKNKPKSKTFIEKLRSGGEGLEPECQECGGKGYTAEHDIPQRHPGGECVNCPIQVRCECKGGNF